MAYRKVKSKQGMKGEWARDRERMEHNLLNQFAGAATQSSPVSAADPTAPHCGITVLQFGSPRSRWQQGRFLLRLLSLACGRPSLHVFSECAHSWCLSVPTFAPEDTSQTWLWTTLMTSFSLGHLVKGCLQTQSHSEVLEVRASTCEFQGHTLQCLTTLFCSFYFGTI